MMSVHYIPCSLFEEKSKSICIIILLSIIKYDLYFFIIILNKCVFLFKKLDFESRWAQNVYGMTVVYYNHKIGNIIESKARIFFILRQRVPVVGVAGSVSVNINHVYHQYHH